MGGLNWAMDEAKNPLDSQESEPVLSEDLVSNYRREESPPSPEDPSVKVRKFLRDLLILVPALAFGIVVSSTTVFFLSLLFGGTLGPTKGAILLLVWLITFILPVAGTYRLFGSDSFQIRMRKPKNPR